MKVSNINSSIVNNNRNINNKQNLTFKGPMDGVITNVLRTCDMNEMVNAVALDVGAISLPRAYYDTKERGSLVGMETFIREFSGAFINCLSAGLFAMGFSKIASKHIMPEVKINSESWYTKDSLFTLRRAWNKTGNLKDYFGTVLDNISGRDGHKINNLKDADWSKVDWIDEAKWSNYSWKNPKYAGIQNRLKSKEGFVSVFMDLMEDNNLKNDDRKKIFSIMEKRLTNVLGAERDTKLEVDGHKVADKLENIIRDAHDMGKDILKGKSEEEIRQVVKKIGKVNKFKTATAITASCVVGLTNQALNRKITEKRTGIKGFVGDLDYGNKDRVVKKDKWLPLKKFGASALMAAMVCSTMGVKNFKEFAKKIEFKGPITEGNAIKTVYGATIIGRFLAADNGTELRETMTRDYLGFLNWLVFGGFFAKGIANILDKKGTELFNYSKEGKGVAHWLYHMNLKTHNEIASKGKEYAKKNLWKLNVAQASGIAYSAVTLGILLPMLNAKITEHKAKKQGKLQTKTV